MLVQVQIKISDNTTKISKGRLGKEPGAELITKSRKRSLANNKSGSAAVHSNTKIQQLYKIAAATSAAPLVSLTATTAATVTTTTTTAAAPKKSPGLAKRNNPAKRKKKNSIVPNENKSAPTCSIKDGHAAVGNPTDNQLREEVDPSHIITEAISEAQEIQATENVVLYTADLDHHHYHHQQHHRQQQHQQHQQTQQLFKMNEMHQPQISAVPMSPSPVITAQIQRIYQPTNKTSVPQSSAPTIAPPMSPKMLASSTTSNTINKMVVHKESNVPMVDETNPRFVKYYDPNTMSVRQTHTTPGTTIASTASASPSVIATVVPRIVKQSMPPAMTSNVVVKNPPIQNNININNKSIMQNISSSVPATVQTYTSVAAAAAAASASASNTIIPTRIPPKINILSQQTIKSNINFVDNKLIIKPDSKLANVLKSQKYQFLPATNNIVKSNMIIRGTNQLSPRKPIFNTTANNMMSIKMLHSMDVTTTSAGKTVNATTPVTSTTNPYNNVVRDNLVHDRNVYVLNMPSQATTMAAAAAATAGHHVHKITTIEKIELDQNVITEDTPVDIIATATASAGGGGGGQEYIIEEVDTYETPHLSQMVANVRAGSGAGDVRGITFHSSARGLQTVNDGQRVTAKAMTTTPQYAKIHRKLPKGVQYRAMAPQIHNPTQQTQYGIVYEQQGGIVVGANWEVDQNTGTVLQSRIGNSIVSDAIDYESNIIYAETLDDENITEEYVTTEEYDTTHGEF